MTRMFKLWKESEIKTVNPFNGCEFNCYDGNCWAAQMARRHEAMGTRGYENGFEPSWCPWRIEKDINAEICWIGSMGDIAFQKTRNIKKIIREMIVPNPETTFFLESKEPSNFVRFIDDLPRNVLLSTTIETNRPYNGISKAPVPYKRFESFKDLFEPFKNLFDEPGGLSNKHLSIEPVMDFDLSQFESMIRQINPVIVSMGYDNYNCNLPEPEPEKFYQLASELQEYTQVEFKTRPEELDRYDSKNVPEEVRKEDGS